MFWQHLLLAVHIIVCVALIGVILLQRSEGGAFGMGGGGGGGFMTARGAGDLLTRITAVLATLFFVLSLALTLLAGRGGTGSVIERMDVNKLDLSKPAVPAPSLPTAPLPGGGPLEAPRPTVGGAFPAAPQNSAAVPPALKTQPADPLANVAGGSPQPATR